MLDFLDSINILKLFSILISLVFLASAVLSIILSIEKIKARKRYKKRGSKK